MEKNFWRERLSRREQVCYDKMYEAFSLKHECVTCDEASLDRLDDVYFALCNDHPELYYLPPRVDVRHSGGAYGRTEVLIKNLFDSAQIARYDRVIDNIKREIVLKTRFCRNTFEKEKRVCEYLLEHTTYELNTMRNQNAATVLVDGVGQCSGIAKAAKLLLDGCGIQNIFVSGSAKERPTANFNSHAWNIVEIGRETYHLDVTFMLGANPPGTVPHKMYFFNYTDDEMKATHRWDRAIFPTCNTFYQNKDMPLRSAFACSGSTATAKSGQDVERLFEDAVRRGEKELLFEIKISLPPDEIMDIIHNACRNVLDRLSREYSLSLSITMQSGIVKLNW